jgi:ATP-dependent RNA helicase DeaD
MVSFLKFNELNISPEILKAIEDMGFEEPTPIQQRSIPFILSGRDVTGQAQTGTGKTAAFAIPVIENTSPEKCMVQSIILSPTRELTIQISEEFNRLLSYRQDIRVLPVYGGQPIERQIHELKKGVQILIGTPGRVMDHLRRGTLSLSGIKTVVLDEADQMLEMGFREDMEEILSNTPKDRQTILFSATMPKPILKISKSFQNKPEFVSISPGQLTVPSIEQKYLEVRDKDKLEVLCRLMDINSSDLSMIFCNTKKKVDELSGMLRSRGYFAEGLHGDMKQQQRDRVMSRFRSGSIDILIATDVAARGIDIDDIDIVYNFDVPQDVEYYVHRIGRTGRAGKSGASYTLVSPKEIYKLRMIKKLAKVNIVRIAIPDAADVENSRIEKALERVKAIIDDEDLGLYIPAVERLMEEDCTLVEISAALLKIQLEGNTGKIQSGGEFEPGDTGAEPGMVRFFVNIGKNKGIRPSDFVGAIAGEAEIPGNEIGAIDIMKDFSFVEVPEQYAKKVFDVMNRGTIRGNEVSFEPAKRERKQRSRY